MKKTVYTTLLTVLLVLSLASCNALDTKQTTIASDSSVSESKTEIIYVEVENIDYKDKGIICAHEKDVFLHKVNLNFGEQNIDAIQVGDKLEITYSESIKENPEMIIVSEYRVLD